MPQQLLEISVLRCMGYRTLAERLSHLRTAVGAHTFTCSRKFKTERCMKIRRTKVRSSSSLVSGSQQSTATSVRLEKISLQTQITITTVTTLQRIFKLCWTARNCWNSQKGKRSNISFPQAREKQVWKQLGVSLCKEIEKHERKILCLEYLQPCGAVINQQTHRPQVVGWATPLRASEV